MSEEQKKPDYKDFGITENMYQRKYILKKGEPIPLYGIRLISLIPFLILIYYFPNKVEWTSETSFYEYIEILWEQWGDPLSIFVLGFVYFFSSCVVHKLVSLSQNILYG